MLILYLQKLAFVYGMVKATKGLLLNWYKIDSITTNITVSDAAVREILIKLDQSFKFIIEDLDEHHLFIDGAQLPRVQLELDKRLAENVYLPPDTFK